MGDIAPVKKTEGVLTKEELKKEESVKAPSSKKTTKVKKPVEVKSVEVKKDIQERFECGFAPGGNSNIAFIHKYQGVDYKYDLKLVNRIYILPKGVIGEERLRLRAALKANGFADITVIKSGAIFDKQKGTYIYTVMHPDHTSRNRVNGTISLALMGDNGKPMFDPEGKQIAKQVTIQNGIVKTEDKDIYKALLTAGFVSGGKIEKEEADD